ncbi:Neuronal membrane glycoprotein M6-b [Larimichthys crocea]|uniref:Uncharacterized protein n=1 Tax=Larimichthys crocea TaxID=215358 RepID=A0ACD3QX60_LARCR|nr:Neuronal membrane glycoprotein M6-b [Larimichthys crocea]
MAVGIILLPGTEHIVSSWSPGQTSRLLKTIGLINVSAISTNLKVVTQVTSLHISQSEGLTTLQQNWVVGRCGAFGYGCFECCIKCLGGVPYASLVATILCFSGVALFCGCGHVALTSTLTMLENHFSRVSSDHATLALVIQIFQYIIYGIASFFFVYAIILLAEGFYTTSAIKKELQIHVPDLHPCSGLPRHFRLHGDPRFPFFNMWTTCAAMRSPDANITSPDSICVDVRQYGIIPWNATPGKACGATLGDICNTSEFYLSYHLYIVAFAGAGATVIALIHYLMILSANWAYLKSAVSTHDYQDIKTKDDQDLEAEARSKEGQNSSSYS